MSSNAAYEIENDIIKRTRNKERLPPFVFNREDVAYLASIYGEPLENNGQFGREFIEASSHHPRDTAKDPEKFPPAILRIEGAFLPIDNGFDDREPKYQPASERAKSLAEKWAAFGVFIPANGNKPTRAEVEEAKKKLEHTYKRNIAMSDEQWRKTGSVMQTISNAPVALKYFGLERDWAERASEQEICPFCQRSVKSKAVKCGNDNCGAILNWAEAYRGGIVTKEQALEHGVKVV